MSTVFLGGTCAGPSWRDAVIPRLAYYGMGFFNPVTEEWDHSSQALERLVRRTCDWDLYVLTPYMEGVYSVAEVVDDSNKQPEKTILVISHAGKGFSAKMDRSLDAVTRMVRANGAAVFYNTEAAIQYMVEKDGTN